MTNTPTFTRRKLIKGITASSLIPLLGSNLIGCSNDSSRRGTNPEQTIDSVPADFNHGVASGDPLADRVILWTRVTPERDGDVLVDWELASDEDFANIITSGSGVTTADVDYTVKVDAEGLDAGSTYFFRFITGEKTSPVGKTRTAALGSLATASFAVVSCSNYPAGFFNVYREIANRDIDAVIHLGDYLYEYAADGYASSEAEELGRIVAPLNELVSLEDYRLRYAQYHGDADLQACHQNHPFIIVWDDHEVTNNAWRDGAENHQPATEGDYGERKVAAIQAWYEWLPVRPPSSEREIIYRQLQFGDLVDLLMLDTRIVGRDEQVDYTRFFNGGIIDVDTVRAVLADSNRTLLGETQRDWLKGALTESTARWQVLGQQVIMARQPLPEPVARAFAIALSGGDVPPEAVQAILAAARATNKAPGDRTEQEQALLDSAIPLNTDAWDGYDFEREDILTHASQVDSRLVVLSGDIHNAWNAQLTTADGSNVGVEFTTSSVSSPGFEDALGAATARTLAPLAVSLMEDVKYANLSYRGYYEISFTAEKVEASYHFIDTVKSTDYSVLQDEGKTFSVDRNSLTINET